MRRRLVGLSFTALLAMIALTTQVSADPSRTELYECEMVADGTATVVQLSTFGQDGSTALISGALVRPVGDGPFPAVVLLHRVFGIETPDCFKKEMSRYRSWDYIVLLIDSNSAPREIRSGTSGETPTGYSHVDQAADALAGTAYLASLSNVASSKIAVVGHAYGGSAVLRVVSLTSMEEALAHWSDQARDHILAAVAWHPACPVDLRNVGAPLLLITGASDSLNSSHACDSMKVTTLAGIAPPRHEVFTEAGHNFDVDWFTEYNAETTERAYDKIKQFLLRRMTP